MKCGLHGNSFTCERGFRVVYCSMKVRPVWAARELFLCWIVATRNLRLRVRQNRTSDSACEHFNGTWLAKSGRSRFVDLLIYSTIERMDGS